MKLNFVNKGWFKVFYRFAIIFIISYILSLIVLNASHLAQIASIDLNLFSFCVSLIITMAVLLLDNSQIALRPKLSFSSDPTKLLLLWLAAALIFIIVVFVFGTTSFNQIAFSEWRNLPILGIASFLATFFIALYGPAYILHGLFFRSFKLTLLEKSVFYPVISGVILVSIKVLTSLLNFNIPYFAILIGLISGVTILFLNEHLRLKKTLTAKPPITIDLKEVMALVAAIIFNLVIFYMSIGGNNAFLRGDMWSNAQAVGFINKNGLAVFISSIGGTYPPFYYILGSAISGLTPFPFINGLIIGAFFNHLFSILAFYLLAKMLFKDSRKALLSLFLWTAISGLSWSYLSLNPPIGALSQNQLLAYITSVGNRFGFYSGSIFTATSADGEAFTRLWALGLLFISIAVLLKSYFDRNSLKYSLMIFSLCAVQVLLGHMTEIPIIALAIFLLILIEAKPSSKFTKTVFLVTLFSSSVGGFFVMLFSGLSVTNILLSFSPVFAVILAVIFIVAFQALRYAKLKYSPGRFLQVIERFSWQIKALFFVLFLYFYGLMWLAFFGSSAMINWPVSAVWYSYAVQWGVLGGIAVLVMFWFGLKKDKLQFGLKFAISLFLLQLILLIGLNFFNYYVFYVQIPYPFQPIFFIPVLALIASQAFPKISHKKGFTNKIYAFLLVAVVLIVFLFGSLDYVLSSSFTKSSDGYWLYPAKMLNPSTDDYQLINYLYANSSTNYFVGTFYSWNTPSSYVVYASGFEDLSQPLIDILAGTNDSKEIYILEQTLPISYILVPSNESFPQNSYLANAINTVNPIFSNSKYKLYSINQFDLTKTDLLPKSNNFVTAEQITFDGDLTYTSNLNSTVNIRNAHGNIYPLDNGLVTFSVQYSPNETSNTTVLTPSISITGNITLVNMKSTWKYFIASNCIADKIIISGQTSFQVFNTVKNRIYADPFNYTGSVVFYPSPSGLTPSNAKQMIVSYLDFNYVDPLKTVTGNFGIIWTLIIVFIIFFVLAPKKLLSLISQRFRFNKNPIQKGK